MRLHLPIYSILLILGLFFCSSVPKSEAARLSLFFEKAKIEIDQQQEIVLYLDSENETLNALEADFLFPEEYFEILNVTDGSSIIGAWIEKPQYNSEQNTLSFSGIVPGGFQGTKGKIASIHVIPKKEGKAEIFLRRGSAYQNDGEGTLVKLAYESRLIEIMPQKNTETLPETGIPSIIQGDRRPPQEFKAEITQDPNIFNGEYFLVFQTTDKESGVSHYEVLEVAEMGSTGLQEGSWTKTESPYRIKDQTLRKRIYVRAVDYAGNFILIEAHSGDGINLEAKRRQGFNTRWLLLLLLIGVGIFFRRLYQKKYA